MGTDNGTYIRNQNLTGGKSLLYQIPQCLRLITAAGMANQYRFLVGNCGFLHMVKKRPYCRLSPPYLFYRDQVPLVIDMQNRLDIQHGSHCRRRRRNPASPFEIGEIVYGEPVTNLQFYLFRKIPDLLNGCSGQPLSASQQDQQALSSGSRQVSTV